MRADGVVVVDIRVDCSYHLLRRDVLVDIDLFVLQTMEESFCADVIERLPLSVHGNLDITAFHQVEKTLIGEVASLVRIDNFRFPVTQHAVQTP